VIPSRDIAAPITHVILAFLRSEVFHAESLPTDASDYPLFMSVDDVRTHFELDTKVMVAIGGWGDATGFEAAAKDDVSRKQWAAQVKNMVDLTGADGVDMDWEYPG
jgi:GH18 family chitinase